MIADYNGWTDLPEAEREALDILELSPPVPSERRGYAPVKERERSRPPTHGACATAHRLVYPLVSDWTLRFCGRGGSDAAQCTGGTSAPFGEASRS
jgi:hypothetical protein